MSEGRSGHISAVIRDIIPLSDVADYLNISRPTLYKYMDFYDSGEFEKIPSATKNYFDFISSGKTTRKEVHEYFLQEGKKLKDEEPPTSNISDRWTEGDLPTLCIGWNGTATVFFKDSMPDAKFTKLTAYISDNGDQIPIGTYVPEPDMKFITVKNLVPKLNYTYIVEQISKECVKRSIISDLKLR